MDLSEIMTTISRADSLAEGLKKLFDLEVDDPLHTRRAIFVASASKLAEQARAIKLLADQGLHEEVVGLSRVMIEVVINGIYLQFCSDEEVTAFLRFDSLKIRTYLADKALANGDPESSKRHEADALRIGRSIGRTGKEFSWSKKSLAKRATAVDQEAEVKVFVILQENSSMLGCLPLHGSFISMMHLMPSEHKAWPHRDNFCREASHLVLNALKGFAISAEKYFPPPSRTA